MSGEKKVVVLSIDFILAIAACIALILVAATYITYLNKHWWGGSIKVGCSPKDAWGCNSAFYASCTSVIMTITALCFAIFEIGIIFKGAWFTSIKNRLVRAVFYLLQGMMTLGMMNDLGIAAGSIEMIVAGVMIIIEVFFICKNR
ncbi:hypothetical protein GPJ56_010338 [Histomonas meleagridis]|uniref:uncharacterized protein n=1 Tax=Histomonas meleagridis TaxID=135588 RepID=UPI003559DE96|nr:hypothetical protein GPJ56_010338 [Histomonas meleagridis]KAH0797945.1 hypothetical protein GO595_009574 [Histomonas meleagridis]